MKKLKSVGIKLWKDESGQGTAEYVLILVAVAGAAFIFKDKIKNAISQKMTTVTQALADFKGDAGG